MKAQPQASAGDALNPRQRERLLNIESVSKSFAGLTVLRDVSLTVRAGELVGLIGPNGSGKTTLINMINGYHAPDSGGIEFDGVDIAGRRPNHVAKLGMARMFQMSRIYPKLTLMENMLSVAYATGRIATKDAEAKAEDILGRLYLKSYFGERAGSLSGGQRRLLEFGLCFMGAPKLVLLDEPFASVHPELKAVLDENIHLRHQEGATFLLVSHDIASMVESCTRIVALAAGSVIADGPAKEVTRNEKVIEIYLGEPLES